jgi:hypothetical protein
MEVRVMEKDRLSNFTIAAARPPEPPATWRLKIQVGNTNYDGWTDSRIVGTVLETALLAGRKHQRWPVEVEIEDTHSIQRIRIYDDREDICKGILDTLKGLEVMPLTPTAFADERPPKWGFFFAYRENCREAKGTSLDVYSIIETAWKEEGRVVLKFNEDDLIIDARRV